MARRSPTNERYQKYTSPSGKTRKSAAAAKPKRAGGATSTPKSKPKKTARTAADRSAPYAPPTAEYKRWRRIWWILLVTALVLTGASWIVRKYATGVDVLANILLGAGYSAIFGALYIDWTKLRRLRNDWIKAGRPMGDPSATKPKETNEASASTKDSDDSKKPGSMTS